MVIDNLIISDHGYHCQNHQLSSITHYQLWILDHQFTASTTFSLLSFCKINTWSSITAGSSTCVMLSDIYHYCSWSSNMDSQSSDLTYHPCCECWATCAAGGYPAPSGRIEIKVSEILYKCIMQNSQRKCEDCSQHCLLAQWPKPFLRIRWTNYKRMLIVRKGSKIDCHEC